MKEKLFGRLFKCVSVMLIAFVIVGLGGSTLVDAATGGTSGRWRYEFNDDNETVSVRALGDVKKNGVVEIPSKIVTKNKTYPVTGILDGGLSSCSTATEIIIPNTIKNIGAYAFQGCYGLTSITIPASVETIGEFAFDECVALNFINVAAQNSNYSSIEGAMYNEDASSLICVPAGFEGEFDIPDSVTDIASGAFAYCEKITTINMTSSITSIGEAAFKNCTSLTDMTIPGSVTYMGSSIFQSCSNLTTVRFEEGVTYIESYAFQYCESLTTVYIPSSCGGFGYSIFESCTIITKTSIIFAGGEEQKAELAEESESGNEDILGVAVMFQTNCDATVPTQYLDKGEKAVRPEDPDNTPYNDLIDWYVDEACTEPYDFDEEVEQTIKLYADWKSWNLVVEDGDIYNWGSEDREIRDDNAKANFKYNDPVVVSPKPAPEGMKFGFWSRDGGKTPITYEEAYFFYYGVKEVLTPVYVDKNDPLEGSKNIIITPSILDINVEKRIVSLGNEAYVPNNVKYVEMGIIATSDDTLGADKDSFDINNEDFIAKLANAKNTDGYIYTNFAKEAGSLINDKIQFVKIGAKLEDQINSAQFTWRKGSVSDDATWYVRGFVIYQDADNNYRIVYSDINSANLQTIDPNDYDL